MINEFRCLFILHLNFWHIADASYSIQFDINLNCGFRASLKGPTAVI